MSDPDIHDAPTTEAPKPSESFRAAGQDVRDILDALRLYASARLDSIRLAAKTLGLYAVLAMAGLLAIAGVLLAAGAMIVVGIAEGLTALIHIGWLADLIAGLLVLGIIFGSILIAARRFVAMSMKATRDKYEKLEKEHNGRQ